MIHYITGNIFESNAECLVNTVNCEGYMGKGVAYQFKQKYPENNKDYVRACKNGELHIGTIHSFSEGGKLIVNFPTKNKWREKSKIIYVEKGLDLLVDLITEKSVTSIAIPPLGCGNGGLIWGEVKPLVEEKMTSVIDKCDITVYEPSASYKPRTNKAPQLDVSSLVLLQIKMQLNKWDSVRLQGACYFFNYFLGNQYFKFDNWKKLPYSKMVNVMAKKIKEYQNYYHFENSTDTYKQAYQVITSKRTDKTLHEMMPAIKKASEYVNRIDTNRELKGIATILYLVQNNSNINESEALDWFRANSDEKSNDFSQSEIADYLTYLENTGVIMKNIFGFYEVLQVS